MSAAVLVAISGNKDSDKPKVQKVVSKPPATEPQANAESWSEPEGPKRKKSAVGSANGRLSNKLKN